MSPGGDTASTVRAPKVALHTAACLLTQLVRDPWCVTAGAVAKALLFQMHMCDPVENTYYQQCVPRSVWMPKLRAPDQFFEQLLDSITEV